MKVDFRNLTNTGFIRCSPFKENRAAKIQIFSGKIVHNENSKNLLKFDLIKLILSILKLNMKVYENINLPKINCFLYKIFIFKK